MPAPLVAAAPRRLGPRTLVGTVNGPGNYAEAQNIVLDERCDYGCPHSGCPHEMAYLARALVHAVQANTAAIIAGARLDDADRHEWLTATEPDYAAGQDTSPAQPTGGTA